MTDLTAIGSSAIGALRAALATVGENVANAETPGYVRRTVRVAELAPSGTVSGPRLSGVRLSAIERQWDARLGAETRRTASDAALATAKAESAGLIESALADNEDGVGRSLTDMFIAGDRWAADPGSRAEREAWIGHVDATVRAFNRSGEALERAEAAVDEKLVASTAEANRLLAEVAEINRSIRTARRDSAQAAELFDRRDHALDRLSVLIDVSVELAGRGEAVLRVGSATLVDGPTNAQIVLETSSSGQPVLVANSPFGNARLQPASGGIAGLIAGRQSIAQRRAELDSLARDFANGLNAWSQSGLRPDLLPGNPMVGGEGAIGLRQLVTDSAQLAPATAEAANGNLLALRALRQTGHFEERWDMLVRISATAKAMSDRTEAASVSIHEAARTALASRTGVDLDREAADLLKLQQAYGAAARILEVAKSVIDSLLAIR